MSGILIIGLTGNLLAQGECLAPCLEGQLR